MSNGMTDLRLTKIIRNVVEFSQIESLHFRPGFCALRLELWVVSCIVFARSSLRFRNFVFFF